MPSHRWRLAVPQPSADARLGNATATGTIESANRDPAFSTLMRIRMYGPGSRSRVDGQVAAPAARFVSCRSHGGPPVPVRPRQARTLH